ncbi:MAG: SGNH/GDSL hydrolase family protein [Elusimicrobia bacterium]|nr:SGNH/GDSL hydrolase family protein [Elusimicrobiota bacterium]
MIDLARLKGWLQGAFAPRPLRALFVGNSLTYFEAPAPEGRLVLNDLPALLSRISPRLNMRTDRISRDGASLEDHLSSPSLAARLRPGAWDLVVLQENSERAINDAAGVRRDARELCARIKASGARPLLFATWAPSGRPEAASGLDRFFGGLAAELGALLVPVGRAWEEAGRERPRLALRMPDGAHPGPLGAYLSACVFRSCLKPRNRLELALQDIAQVEELARTHDRLRPGEGPSAVLEDDLEFLRRVAARAAHEAGVEPPVAVRYGRP